MCGLYAYVLLLVLLDATSTYLGTSLYSPDLELNPILRCMLVRLGRVAAVLYAPAEFAILVLLLTLLRRSLASLGVAGSERFCKLILLVLYALVALNWVGVAVALLAR